MLTLMFNTVIYFLSQNSIENWQGNSNLQCQLNPIEVIILIKYISIFFNLESGIQNKELENMYLLKHSEIARLFTVKI